MNHFEIELVVFLRATEEPRGEAIENYASCFLTHFLRKLINAQQEVTAPGNAFYTNL